MNMKNIIAIAAVAVAAVAGASTNYAELAVKNPRGRRQEMIGRCRHVNERVDFLCLDLAVGNQRLHAVLDEVGGADAVFDDAVTIIAHHLHEPHRLRGREVEERHVVHELTFVLGNDQRKARELLT